MSAQIPPSQDVEPDILDIMNTVAHVSAPSSVQDTVIKRELDLSSQVSGRADTLRNSILSFVADGKYDLACRELILYRDAKGAESSYLAATQELFSHCLETIEAQKTLLTSQDIAILPMAKRYDIYARVKKLFGNTRDILVRLEQIENDLLVRDARSITWFLQSLFLSVFFVICFAAFAEAVTHLGSSVEIVAEDASNFIFNLVGW